jgi:hypothetical protein
MIEQAGRAEVSAVNRSSDKVTVSISDALLESTEATFIEHRNEFRGRSRTDWMPLWRSLMDRKLQVSQVIAQALERAITPLNLNDGLTHHLEPVSTISNEVDGLAVRLNHYRTPRAQGDSAVTITCRKAIKGRLGKLEVVSEKIDRLLRDRKVSERWVSEVRAHLQSPGGNLSEDDSDGSFHEEGQQDDDYRDVEYVPHGNFRVYLGVPLSELKS